MGRDGRVVLESARGGVVVLELATQSQHAIARFEACRCARAHLNDLTCHVAAHDRGVGGPGEQCGALLLAEIVDGVQADSAILDNDLILLRRSVGGGPDLQRLGFFGNLPCGGIRWVHSVK